MTLGRLERIVLRAGSRPGEPRTVDLSPVTVLVGPNNGGKSTALTDLNNFAMRNQANGPIAIRWEGGIVVESAQLPVPESRREVMEFLDDRLHGNDEGEYLHVRSFGAAGGQESGTIDIPKVAIDPERTPPWVVAEILMPPYTLLLNGQQRFNLAQGAQSGRLNAPPNSAWMAIERDANLFAEVDRMIFAAFDEHLVIQTFEPPNLRPALSPNGLPSELRQSTSPGAVSAQEDAKPLGDLSDGVQVFSGLVAAVAALPHLLLLIDEPEAFLHPTLSRRLGADLARIAKERDARLIVATHSAEFLLGCLDEVPETSVLRLDYRKGVPSSHVMVAAEVARLSRDPLLRSSNALQALFARSAVVCEADADRAFYTEINRRLQRSDTRVGALDTQFLNAQNWQTTARLTRPLRAAGVPAAVVLDLETLANNDTWSDLVEVTGADVDSRDDLLEARASARDAILALGRASANGPLKAKVGGLDAFADGPGKAKVETAIQKLAAVGIFLVPVGELEGWLLQFGCTNKKTWVTDMLGRLGAPGDPAYVEPGDGDVWGFVESIAEWLEDPSRSGMPA
jgi:hypothetical protein